MHLAGTLQAWIKTLGLNFQKIQSSIEADIDRIVPSASIVRNDYDKRQKLIFISLRASINSSLLRDRLIQSGAAAQMPSKEKKLCMWCFRSTKANKRYCF